MKAPSRALIAYSLISKHLQHGSGAPDVEQAAMEFFRAVAVGKENTAFDAEGFCRDAFQHFGMRISTPIVKSWAPRLERAGILRAKSVTRAGNQEYKEYVYCEISEGKIDADAEVEEVLATFRKYFRSEFSELGKDCSDEQIDEAFLSRLMHLESLKVLAKRHQARPASLSGIKRTRDTLTLAKQQQVEVVSTPENQLESILDIAVADFLLTTVDDNPKLFSQISSVAYANLAVETLIAFAEPAGPGQAFTNAQVFFDTPLILDMLQLHPDREEYGKEFKDMVIKAKISPAIFEHTLVELDDIVKARLRGISVDPNASQYIHRAVAETTRTVNRLRSFVDALEPELNRIGISVLADEPLGLSAQRSKVMASLGPELDEKLKSSGWGENPVARERDIRSICDVIALRNSRRDIDNIHEVPYVIVSSNASLVNIANSTWKSWLTENSVFNVSRKAPIAINDRQLAGLIWIVSGAPLEDFSRARLVANCASTLRPSEEATKAVYNMIVDSQGTEDAERFAAVMTDQRAQRMFMKQTAGDSRSLSSDDLPSLLGDLQATLISEKTKEFQEKEQAIQARVSELSAELGRTRDQTTAFEQALMKREANDRERFQAIQTRRDKRRIAWQVLVSAGVAAFSVSLAPVFTLIANAFGYVLLGASNWGIAAVLAFIGMWKIPDLFFSEFCEGQADQFFVKELKNSGLEHMLYLESEDSAFTDSGRLS